MSAVLIFLITKSWFFLDFFLTNLLIYLVYLGIAQVLLDLAHIHKKKRKNLHKNVNNKPQERQLFPDWICLLKNKIKQFSHSTWYILKRKEEEMVVWSWESFFPQEENIIASNIVPSYFGFLFILTHSVVFIKFVHIKAIDLKGFHGNSQSTFLLLWLLLYIVHVNLFNKIPFMIFIWKKGYNVI